MVVTVRNISRHTVVFRPPSGGQTDLSPGSAVELGSDRYIVTGAPAANTEHSESLRAHIDGILVISVWRLNLARLGMCQLGVMPWMSLLLRDVSLFLCTAIRV
ncbi:hypothetical protein APHAL10511_000041 [Amanita phalloides]|nr:hypothetical protein APHAL10511_000041 [Amanita phalloides]